METDFNGEIRIWLRSLRSNTTLFDRKPFGGKGLPYDCEALLSVRELDGETAAPKQSSTRGKGGPAPRSPTAPP
jgi:hypothetical protein